MGGATLWPIPRSIDVEAHHYPRNWKRNLLIFHMSALLMLLQVNRYSFLGRQSSMKNGEYIDWGDWNAPKRVRY